MIVQTRYKDVEYGEQRCEHIHPSLPPEESKQKWAQLRGQPIAFDSETFKEGECPDCDTWHVHPYREAIRGSGQAGVGDFGGRLGIIVVNRKSIEIGD